MLIKKGNSFLMIRINTPSSYVFYDEHVKLIEQNGYVWFCKISRGNLLTRSISKFGNFIFVKETVANGDGVFMLEYDELSESPPAQNFPEYYKHLNMNSTLWFKVTRIHKLNNDDINDSFVAKASYNDLKSVYRTICNTLYITAIKNIEL